MTNLEELGQIDAYKKAKEILKDMYESDEGKKFIHHLIYAFTAGTVTHIAVSSKPVFDCISKSKLNTVYEKYNSIKSNELKDLLKIIANKETVESDKLCAIKSMEIFLVQELNENPKKRLALKSTLTNKVLGSDEYQALIDFRDDKIKKGNKVISSMTKYINYQKLPNKSKSNKKVKFSTNLSKKSIGADEDLRAKLMKAINNN